MEMILYVIGGLAFAWLLFNRAGSVTEEELEEMNECGFYDVSEYREVAADVQHTLNRIEMGEIHGDVPTDHCRDQDLQQVEHFPPSIRKAPRGCADELPR